MALTLLYRPTLARIGALELDASISETHTAEVEVTEHPIEKGANISDHVRAKPENLSIEGVVSNTPVNRAQNARAVKSQGKLLQTTSDVDAIQGHPGVAESAYDQLRALKDSGQLITVVTKLRTYRNMVLRSLSIPRSAKIGDMLQFTAQFIQVNLVENGTVILPTRKSGKVDRHTQPPKPAPAPEIYRSQLKFGTDALGATKAGDGHL